MKKSLLLMALSFICCWMGSSRAFALDQIDGVYQIGNAQDLEDFSNMVASGNGGISGALTADIDMTGVAHMPIGTTSSLYTGTFDGQQHFIRNMVIDTPEAEYVGLFGTLGDGAYIKNVIVDASCSISGLRFVAGIAGGTNGGGSVTFENCGNEASIGASQENAAGICGVSMWSQCGIKMHNCFNTGGISGDRECAAFCGWVGDNGSEIFNCYNTGYVIGMDGNNSLWRNGNGKGVNNYDSYGYQGTFISDDDYELSSGAVCYQINGNQSEDVIWFQTLGEDLHPVPFSTHGTVYAVGDLNCDGSSKTGDVTFSNVNESNRDPHQFDGGVCSVCGAVDSDFLPLTDGFYDLSNAIELNWFAALVNSGVKKVNARLTADIDFTEFSKKDVMIGGDAYTMNTDKAFEGVFDGQEHTVTVEYHSSYDGVALFKFIENATVRNLTVDGSIESTQRYAGGLVSTTYGTVLIENVVVATQITGSYPGDATHGGISAVCHNNPTFRNCAFVGGIDAPDCEGTAAIIGYAHGEVETVIENTYVAPTVLKMTGNSTIIARHVRNMINCFYTDNITDMWEDAATMVSQESVGSGELAYNLDNNGGTDAWRQNLGEDAYPVPFASHLMVYANGSLNCDGTAGSDISYSNTKGDPVRDEHQYVDDICSVCGARLIHTGIQLKAIADDINSGAVDGNVIIDLANDIDLAGIEFEGIGTRFNQVDEEGNSQDVKRPYKGTFDGHGYVIKNMLIDSQEGNKGLFGVVSGATIKNVTVDSSCEIYSIGYSAGIVGTSIGRNVLTIENCGNEAMVNVGASGANGAGILGVNDLSEAYVRIINCYNAGDIIGQRECGAISGWLGDNGEIVNCFNCGNVAPESVDGTRTFARYSGSSMSFVNCYELNGAQDNIAQVSEDDVKGGKLCFMLNEGAGQNVFFQTLGTDAHPVLLSSHGVVVKDGDNYMNADTGIAAVETGKTTDSAIYSLSGARQQQLQRGINIVRNSDGTVTKVLVK